MVYAEGWPSTFHFLCQLSVHYVWTRILQSHLGLAARFTVVSDIRPRGGGQRPSLEELAFPKQDF